MPLHSLANRKRPRRPPDADGTLGGKGYYEKAKHGEIDFVVQKDEKIIPIEAKSGRIFRAHASLDNVMKVKSWGLDFASVFCRENTAVEVSIPEGRDIECTIAYMPWYRHSPVWRPS